MKAFNAGVSLYRFSVRLTLFLLVMLIGSVLGTVLAFCNRGENLVSYTRFLLASKPSTMLYFIRIFSFLLATYLAMMREAEWILRILILLKSFVFSFTGASIALDYPSAGWLVYPLVLFSSWFEIIIFCWLWLRYLVFRSVVILRDFWFSASILLFVYFINNLVVQPFTAQLFTYF